MPTSWAKLESILDWARSGIGSFALRKLLVGLGITAATGGLLLAFQAAAPDETGADHDVAPQSQSARAPTATTPTSSKAPEPPELINTGEDFAAIVGSEQAYFDWLYSANPDPALLENIISRECECRRSHETTLARMASKSLVASGTPTEIMRLRVSARPHDDIVVIWLVGRADAADLTDRGGTVYDTIPAWGPQASLWMLTRGADRIWRISSVEDLGLWSGT